jgi:anthranilate phosphoribosyltransferase
VLGGDGGADADLVLMNAAAAIYAAGTASDLREAADAARESIASGAALRTLEEYVRLSRELAPKA